LAESGIRPSSQLFTYQRIGQVVLNFDVDVNGNAIGIAPFGTIDATTYFASYGITLSDITPGS